MLNHSKISLHFLHIKTKRERTRRLEYFGFYFCHFKMAFSTLREGTHEMYQHGGEASSRLKQGKGATVPAKSFDSWEGTGADTEHPLQPPSRTRNLTLPRTAGEGPVLRFYPPKSCATHSNRKSTMHQICRCAEQRKDASLRCRL